MRASWDLWLPPHSLAWGFYPSVHAVQLLLAWRTPFYRRSSLAGGSHSSWRELDVHGENVLSGLGRAAYLKNCWGEVFCGKADAEQLRGPSPINMNASLPSVLLGLL